MKYVFVLIFIIVFAFFDTSIGYTTTSPAYTHAFYMFQHANALHLVINSIAFISIFRTMERFVNKWELSIISMVIAFAASFISMYEIPTVGASGMIYAMIGIFFGLVVSKEITIADKKKFATFAVSISVCLLISFLKHNSNFFLHIYCLLFGLLTSQIVTCRRVTSKRVNK